MKLNTLPFLLAFAVVGAACNKKSETVETKQPDAEVVEPSVSKHEAIANRLMDSMEELASSAMNVSDKDSAQVAAEKINELGDRFTAMAAELKTMDPPSNDLKKEINDKMEARQEQMEESMKGFQEKIESLDEDSQQIVENAFGEFFQKMMAVGQEFQRHFEPEAEVTN